MQTKILLSLFFVFFTVNAFAQKVLNFEDVGVVHPNFQAVDFLRKNEIIVGYLRNKKRYFDGEKPISRAEALKILLMAANKKISRDFSPDFPDVLSTNWFFPFITTAFKNQIVSGFADGNFYPQSQVTRAEFLKMTSLAFLVPENLLISNDTNNNQWYKKFFDFAEEFRILREKNLSPHEALTRAEVAEIIYRMFQIKQKNFTTPYIYSGSGMASFYNNGFAGNNTASGEIYDPMSMTAAHRTLPFGTRIKVFFEDKFVVVRINDRGPYVEGRVLDLSQKAFSLLSPISRGIIEVNFELLSDPIDEAKVLPEAVKKVVSAEALNKKVPADIIKVFKNVDLVQDKKKEIIEPLFDAGITSISKDFFTDIELRNSIPRKVARGSVINFSGRVDNYKHHKITVFVEKFLKNKEYKGKQKHYFANLSGKNFSLGVPFLEKGNYRVGMIIDNQKTSRVMEVEVSENYNFSRKFSAEDIFYQSDLNFEMLPQESKVRFIWQKNYNNQITKLEISQGNKTKSIFVESKLKSADIDFSFFGDFESEKFAKITMFFAKSKNGDLLTQTTNWKIVSSKEIFLTSGFVDFPTHTDLEVKNFRRFLTSNKKLVLEVHTKNSEIVLDDYAYLYKQKGKVKKIRFVSRDQQKYLNLNSLQAGNYVLEIMSSKGEILFNKGIYVVQNKILLPVMKWGYENISRLSPILIREKTNNIRKQYNLRSLNSNLKLNQLAQKYAREMAENNFLGHISPTGTTFLDRIKEANLIGQFGENLAHAKTIDLAFRGLQLSPSHLQNFLEVYWNKLGIGIVQNEKGVYLVQIFGR